MIEIHFFIMLLTLLGAGFITPPPDLNRFGASGLTGEPVQGRRQGMPLRIYQSLRSILLLAFIPKLSLWAQ